MLSRPQGCWQGRQLEPGSLTDGLVKWWRPDVLRVYSRASSRETAFDKNTSSLYIISSAGVCAQKLKFKPYRGARWKPSGSKVFHWGSLMFAPTFTAFRSIVIYFSEVATVTAAWVWWLRAVSSLSPQPFLPLSGCRYWSKAHVKNISARKPHCSPCVLWPWKGEEKRRRKNVKTHN